MSSREEQTVGKKNLLQKRIMKLRGFFNLLYSFLCLRFTRLNQKRLLCQSRSLKVDKLHVGCGNILLRDWLNITFEPREEYGNIKRKEDGVLWLNYNLLKKWPIEDQSIQFVAGSHFIEHLDLNGGVFFFKEAYRVMKKGGVIRISCPDLFTYAENYLKNNKEFFNNSFIQEACTFKNAVTPGEIFIAKAYDSGGAHKWFYDFDSLKHLMESAGFCEVKKTTRRTGNVPDLERIEFSAREIESLYVEALKEEEKNRMKLQLIFQPWCSTFGIFKRVARKASSFPPLGLCYIAAIAEKCGWDVQIIDAEVEGLSHEDILERISRFQPDLIGLTASTPFFHNVVELTKAIKERYKIPVAVGGPHISLMREKAFLEIFDYLFIGESENILPEFFNRLVSQKTMEGLPGIMYRDRERICYCGEATRIQNLDEIPWPARHLIPIEKYYIGTLKGKLNYTSFFLSRGCPFDCVFCANKLYGKKMRRRSIAGAIAELSHIVNDLKIKHIYFLDDTLTLNREYILELCKAIKEAKLKFTFEGSTRADLWDEEMVKIMKSCGLIRISFGLETVDLRVRKIIKKEVPIKSYFYANRLNNRLRIETINSVMLGLPGDTRKSIKRTIDFLCMARDIEHTTYGIAIPYPGTEMLEMARQNKHGLKLLTEDFSQYQRYGYAVMQVGDISPEELIALQKYGLMRIYSCWWRIWPLLRRHGIRAILSPTFDAILTVLRTFQKSIRKKLFR